MTEGRQPSPVSGEVLQKMVEQNRSNYSDSMRNYTIRKLATAAVKNSDKALTSENLERLKGLNDEIEERLAQMSLEGNDSRRCSAVSMTSVASKNSTASDGTTRRMVNVLGLRLQLDKRKSPEQEQE